MKKKEMESIKKKEIKKESVTTAESIHQKILLLKKDIGKRFYKLGAYLKQVRDFELYREIGCQSFEEYIGQPELSFKRSTVYSLIGVYEEFFSKKSNHLDIENIEEIDYTKLDKIRRFKYLPKEEFTEWVEKARVLSLSDLIDEIKESEGTLADREPRLNDVPNREDVEQYKEVVCPACGQKFSVRI